MPYDFRILLYAIFVGGAVVVTVFSFPALTTGGGGGSGAASQAAFDAAFTQELDYCQRLPDAPNCQCFADISSTILADDTPRVPGARYADKQELARGQAAQSC